MLLNHTLRNESGISFSFLCFLTMVSAILLLVPESGVSGATPKSAAEIALYQGADRETILIEGAKKEGTLTLYTSNASMANTLPAAFEKKYPHQDSGRPGGFSVPDQEADGRTRCRPLQLRRD